MRPCGYRGRVDRPGESYAALLLAGGAARRMAGVDKPAVRVAGRSMRDRVLAAVADASPRIVVGPGSGLPPGVLAVREEPAGAGPVAAIAAGLDLLATLPAPTGSPVAAATEPVVAVLAADLPLLTGEAVGLLRDVRRSADADGACYRDESGRQQFLCGVWRLPALRAAVERLRAGRGGSLTGAAMRDLLADLTVIDVAASGIGAPPWFDCDTEDDVRRAEEWAR